MIEGVISDARDDSSERTESRSKLANFIERKRRSDGRSSGSGSGSSGSGSGDAGAEERTREGFDTGSSDKLEAIGTDYDGSSGPREDQSRTTGEISGGSGEPRRRKRRSDAGKPRKRRVASDTTPRTTAGAGASSTERAEPPFEIALLEKVVQSDFLIKAFWEQLYALGAVVMRDDRWRLTKDESTLLAEATTAYLQSSRRTKQLAKKLRETLPLLMLLMTNAVIIGTRIYATEANSARATKSEAGTDSVWDTLFAYPGTSTT